MGIKRVPQPPYSPDLAPYDFWLFPKLRGCRYETIEEMKEPVTKVIDTLTQEDFHGSFQKLLEWYNKYITAGGDYFKEDLSFKCPYEKSLETYLMILVCSVVLFINYVLKEVANVLNCNIIVREFKFTHTHTHTHTHKLLPKRLRNLNSACRLNIRWNFIATICEIKRKEIVLYSRERQQR